jgi:4-hydroxy-tetrahydrodipicolinate synthase
MHTQVTSEAKALAREKVQGLWIAIPTPFTPDAKHVDEDVLLAGVEYYIDELQVEGIFCGGVMGEFWSLTMAERKRVHELVAQQNAGRVPLMAQVGDHCFADTVDLCEHAQGLGIEFGIAMTPYFPPSPPDALVLAWFEQLAEASSLPMFLFNTMYAGYTLSPELIDRLADIETVCGIKNPQGREHLLRVQELAGDRLVVTDAVERDWLDLHLNHGIQSLMSTPALALFQTAGNLPIVEYTRKAEAGDLEGAWEIQKGLEGERAAFDRWMRDPWMKGRTVPIAYLKAWLGLMGFPQGPVRAPLVPLTREEETALRSDLEQLGLVR